MKNYPIISDVNKWTLWGKTYIADLNGRIDALMDYIDYFHASFRVLEASEVPHKVYEGSDIFCLTTLKYKEGVILETEKTNYCYIYLGSPASFENGNLNASYIQKVDVGDTYYRMAVPEGFSYDSQMPASLDDYILKKRGTLKIFAPSWDEENKKFVFKAVSNDNKLEVEANFTTYNPRWIFDSSKNQLQLTGASNSVCSYDGEDKIRWDNMSPVGSQLVYFGNGTMESFAAPYGTTVQTSNTIVINNWSTDSADPKESNKSVTFNDDDAYIVLL